jgi:hypothetical protein
MTNQSKLTMTANKMNRANTKWTKIRTNSKTNLRKIPKLKNNPQTTPMKHQETRKSMLNLKATMST